MSKNINGPINIIRLEGEINKVKKILYVFMDVHMILGNQTKCEDILSDDVTKYIKTEMLKNTEKTIDFFMEHRLSDTGDNLIKYAKYRDMYIEEMEKFFYSNFKKKSKEFEKIRFHYADIRDTYILFSHRSINELLDNYSCSNYSRQTIDKVLNKYKETIEYLSNVIDLFNGKKISTKLTSLKELIKIYSRYNDEKIKKNNKLIIDLFLKRAEQLINMIKVNYDLMILHEKECNEHRDENGYLKLMKDNKGEHSYFFNDTEHLNKIKNNQDMITEFSMKTFALIMDIYFLRRFCDKDYVTNGVFYGGAAHGLLYINFLINKYDFKITHASYSLYDLDKMNKLLKDKFYDDQRGNELFDPPVLIQCSNVNSFPEKFQ
jgi:hypothetical protein